MDGFKRIEKMEMMLWWALQFPHKAKWTGLAERNQFSSGGTAGRSSPSSLLANKNAAPRRRRPPRKSYVTGAVSVVSEIHTSVV